MVASILGAPELFVAHREGWDAAGPGPRAALQVQANLDADVREGRLDTDGDTSGHSDRETPDLDPPEGADENSACWSVLRVLSSRDWLGAGHPRTTVTKRALQVHLGGALLSGKA
ncbi:hypothetical protein [Cellulomonas sp. Leaf334]|uniref:hypothetical protein n=1 Tax=Cellulomonas sp. Leaf334 TaxID=1736339 RepID=UPI0006F2D91B|nr:hypothetical protein [Cellulomonas sp. Leaf334]KQR17239.1 hypothetical protein ASF78_08045 [Cellulomonas sp. Leaf334]